MKSLSVQQGIRAASAAGLPRSFSPPFLLTVEEFSNEELISLADQLESQILNQSLSLNYYTTSDDELKSGLQKLANCRSFMCVKDAHEQLKGKTKFNFPHFFLIGWQKCATTSINNYLRRHPQYLPSPIKVGFVRKGNIHTSQYCFLILYLFSSIYCRSRTFSRRAKPVHRTRCAMLQTKKITY